MSKKIYLVTNRKLAGDNYYHAIEQSIKGGIDGIILREKDLPTEKLLPIAVKIKQIIGDKNIKLIINSNIEVAKAIKSDGIHMPYKEFMGLEVKYNALIGVSVHSVKEAIQAQKSGADYLICGHVFQTDCKKGLEPRGVSWLTDILKKVTIPVIPIGGITPKTIDAITHLPISAVAVMSLIMESKNAKNVIKKLKENRL
ncbi:thiamine phosphate synthase [Proteinivorax tanatarense]|uniref:Thiamine phosphate synthase n=1 Tax=Proteinivorax tanatarense TaxID=1260629 RepID=A0AAU7VJE9_9FIRM